MEPVKRIEIMVNYVELTKILQALERAGVPGHTVIRNVAGKGTRGDMFDDLAMTMLDNVYVIAFFPPEKLGIVVEKLKPVFNKLGGTCFISDAQQLQTTRCVG